MTQGFLHSWIINNVYDKKAVSCLPGRSYRLRQDKTGQEQGSHDSKADEIREQEEEEDRISVLS
jgi:hypothetical protein